MHITSCSRNSRNCRDLRDSRKTLKYGTFGREKFGFRTMSRRIWKLCVASLLIILCFPAPYWTDFFFHLLGSQDLHSQWHSLCQRAHEGRFWMPGILQGTLCGHDFLRHKPRGHKEIYDTGLRSLFSIENGLQNIQEQNIEEHQVQLNKSKFRCYNNKQFNICYHLYLF